MIVDDFFVVLINVLLDNCLLVGEELRMLLQPLVDLVWLLAPATIGSRVLAVGEHDDGDVVLLQEPV